MKTGFRGTFVISWSQTEIDGLEAAPVRSLSVGAAWAWRGDAVQVDGPSGVLRLDQADGSEELRKRAARMVHRLVGAALDPRKPVVAIGAAEPAEPLSDSSFVITDGAKSYTVTLIDMGHGSQPLLMFLDQIPPRGCELWVVHHTLGTAFRSGSEADHEGVICFGRGTRIRTPDGLRLIEDLQANDLVQTKDNGAQPISWIGSRRMTGARLYALPQFRPIRIRSGSFGLDIPDRDLVVSPEHRMLVKGDVARDLFNTPEVLVAAKDLVNGTSVLHDTVLPEVTYVHLLLPDHNVIFANGVETESFHPASMSLRNLDKSDLARLLQQHPELDEDCYTYGGHARRNLSSSEAAILRHAA